MVRVLERIIEEGGARRHGHAVEQAAISLPNHAPYTDRAVSIRIAVWQTCAFRVELAETEFARLSKEQTGEVHPERSIEGIRDRR